MGTRLNQILEHIYLGNFNQGWEFFQTLSNPTPEDLRWAGACLQSLQKPNEAKHMLMQAISQGYPEASIQLAGVYRMANQVTEATEILEKLQGIALSDLDQSFLNRELGILNYQNGNLLQATKYLKMAFDITSSHQDYSIFLPNINYKKLLQPIPRNFHSRQTRIRPHQPRFMSSLPWRI
jgi:tetratricopeptide (TPR) repeat protein